MATMPPIEIETGRRDRELTLARAMTAAVLAAGAQSQPGRKLPKSGDEWQGYLDSADALLCRAIETEPSALGKFETSEAIASVRETKIANDKKAERERQREEDEKRIAAAKLEKK